MVFVLLGKNKKLGLTGRPSSEVGLLATSKLYVLQDNILAFIPQVSKFYIYRFTPWQLLFSSADNLSKQFGDF